MTSSNHFIDGSFKAHRKLNFLAKENLIALQENPYPGRGIVLGIDSTGEYVVQIYWIMGRSDNSRNRRFFADGKGFVSTKPKNPKLVKDSSLIMYTAMAEKHFKTGAYAKSGKIVKDMFAVSSGDQTVDALNKNGIQKLNKKWSYEPDAPNFTPRINGLTIFYSSSNLLLNQMSIIKKKDNNDESEMFVYNLTDYSGFGHCLTTYMDDGNPLPSFFGEPYLLPLEGDINEIRDTYWKSLNEENKISLVVKFINIKNPKDTDLRII